MAQPGVGAAALTDRLCGHAERVHGVCGSSVLKGLFSNGRKQPTYRDCGKNFGDGRDWFGARPRGKRQIRDGVLQEVVSESGRFPIFLPWFSDESMADILCIHHGMRGISPENSSESIIYLLWIHGVFILKVG